MKLALLAGAIVVGGFAAGVAVERVGLVSPVSETAVIATLDEVPYHDCPDEPPIGELRRGDRVFVTGRTADGAWAEIRAPYDTASRVWLRSRWMVTDEDLLAVGVAVPVCIYNDKEPADEGPTTTTTTPPSSTTSVVGSTSSTSSTTSSGTSATSTTTSSTATTSTSTTTTLPADQEGPVIGLFQSTESDLWENGVYCGAQQQTAAISAVVSDPSGVASVQLTWSVGSSSGMIVVPRIADPGIYSVTIGPFADTTLSGGNAPIALQMTALDTLSNSTSVSSGNDIPPVLHDCVDG